MKQVMFSTSPGPNFMIL